MKYVITICVVLVAVCLMRDRLLEGTPTYKTVNIPDRVSTLERLEMRVAMPFISWDTDDYGLFRVATSRGGDPRYQLVMFTDPITQKWHRW